MLKGIDNIQYMGGGTNTADAINAMRNQMFSQGMGARPGVPRIAIVVTDGRSSSLTDTVRKLPSSLC
jgi:Mg-chelatase subunit ChlD